MTIKNKRIHTPDTILPLQLNENSPHLSLFCNLLGVFNFVCSLNNLCFSRFPEYPTLTTKLSSKLSLCLTQRDTVIFANIPLVLALFATTVPDALESLTNPCFHGAEFWWIFLQTRKPTEPIWLSKHACGSSSLVSWWQVWMSLCGIGGDHRWKRPKSLRVEGLLLFSKLLAWRARSCPQSFCFIWSSRRLCMSIYKINQSLIQNFFLLKVSFITCICYLYILFHNIHKNMKILDAITQIIYISMANRRYTHTIKGSII